MIPTASSEFSLKPLLTLGSILALAAAIRFHNIGKDALWLDEMFTVEISNAHGLAALDFPQGKVIENPPDLVSLSKAEPWYYIFPRARVDVHPQLFELVLRAWRCMTPDTEEWIRGLSVVFSLAAIVMLYFAVAAQAGPGPALWGCLIMSLAAVQVEYAQECRSYSLLLFCLLSSCAALLRIEKFGFNGLRGLAFGVSAFAAGFTHYLAFPQLGVLFLYILVRLRGRDRFRCVLTLAIAGFLYCAIWGPFAVPQRDGVFVKLNFTKPQEWTVALWLSQFAVLPMRFLAYFKLPVDAIRWLGIVILLLPTPFIRRHPALLLWWLWLVCGMAAVASFDLFRHSLTMYFSRYTIAISPAMYALIPLLLWHLRGWQRHVLPAIVAIGCALALPGAEFHFKEDWRPVGRFIASRLTPDDIRIMYDTRERDWQTRADLEWMMYYDRAPRGAAVFLCWPPSNEVESRIRAARTIWFFAPFTGGSVHEILPGARILESYEYDQIGTLQRIELPPSPRRS